MTLATRTSILPLLAALTWCVRCAAPAGPEAARPPGAKSARSADRAGPESAEVPDRPTPRAKRPVEKTAQTVPQPLPDTLVDPQTGETAYRIRYKFFPEKILYYVIENELRDSGGFQGTINLGYSARANDRRTIIQRVLPLPAGAGGSDGRSNLVNLAWECDRYEIREKGMAEEVRYDSLRDSYPVAPLRQLGSIPGSRVTFLMDPETGETRNARITLGRVTAPATRKKLSTLAGKCALNRANLRKLHEELGPLFLPRSPRRVGESWEGTQREPISNFGHAVTVYRFTLADVREEDGRRIARIEAEGRVELEPAPEREGALAQKRKRKRIDYRIDSAACDGTIEFDITRGELVRLLLRRELNLSARMASQEGETTTVAKGSSHVLRVSVSHDPPPKPTIVGGPRPPVEKAARRRSGGRTVKDPNAARRRAAATSRRAAARRNAAGGRSAVQPSGNAAARGEVGGVKGANQRDRAARAARAQRLRRQATTRPTTRPTPRVPDGAGKGQ